MAVVARRSIAATRITRVRGAAVPTTRRDRLAGEEPMEIRAGGPGQEPRPIAITMRTPGHDFALAAGFLASEGLAGPGEITRVDYCSLPDDEQRYNVVTVALARPLADTAVPRGFYTSSSCGICGRASLDQVEVACRPLGPGPSVGRDVILGLDARLRAAQDVFEVTGGLHAAGLFGAGGTLIRAHEDVGRHNAVDKVLGAELLAGAWPLAGHILMVSGRASFEIVQKAAVAGVPILCAVSAPSSLAVEAAERFGMTLIGFLRGDGFNIYAHPRRLILGD